MKYVSDVNSGLNGLLICVGINDDSGDLMLEGSEAKVPQPSSQAPVIGFGSQRGTVGLREGRKSRSHREGGRVTQTTI